VLGTEAAGTLFADYQSARMSQLARNSGGDKDSER
jgi:hypothetical protein